MKGLTYTAFFWVHGAKTTRPIAQMFGLDDQGILLSLTSQCYIWKESKSMLTVSFSFLIYILSTMFHLFIFSARESNIQYGEPQLFLVALPADGSAANSCKPRYFVHNSSEYRKYTIKVFYRGKSKMFEIMIFEGNASQCQHL
jgi:hypothetical protein